MTANEIAAMTNEEQFNDRYNQRIAEVADFEGGDTPYDDTSNGKRVPYMGWVWRDVDFANKRIPIGVAESGYVGIMESNKWGYAERLMTQEEAAMFMGFLESAFGLWAQGAQEHAENIFAELRAWFQTLTINEEPER